jgi:hypothetical protein
LSERSQGLWRSVVPARCRSEERLALLQAALECLDRLGQLQAILAAEPLVTVTEKTGAKHAHPAVKLELEARRQFGSLWEQLGLSWNGLVDGRAP